MTVTGVRTYVPSTLFEDYKQRTYIDTFKFTLPRAEGIINGQEIHKEHGNPLLGTLSIVNNKIRIDLFYDNYDKNTKVPLTWNGDYILKW